MKNKILSNKGITLIALVITIIVLLILVGIVIAALTGENGILSRATEARAANALGEAKDKCALIAAEEAEEYYKATYVNQTEAYSDGELDRKIVTALNTQSSTLAEGVTAEINGEGRDATITLTHTETSATVAGTITNGTIAWNSINYGGTSGGSQGGGTEPAANTPSASYLALREGDTVYYKDASNNDIECTVLYDSQNANYSTYGVQIIPRNPVTTVELGNGTGNTAYDATSFATAKNSHNNAIGILNTAAATYVSNNSNLSAIAQSSRCVGSIPNNPSARNTATYSHISGTNDYFASYDGQFEAGEEDATYIANNTTNYTVDKAQLDRLSIATITDTTNGSNYWLASRFLKANSSATMFLVHVVDSSGGLNQRGTCNVYSNGGQPTYSCTMRIAPSHNSKV